MAGSEQEGPRGECRPFVGDLGTAPTKRTDPRSSPPCARGRRSRRTARGHARAARRAGRGGTLPQLAASTLMNVASAGNDERGDVAPGRGRLPRHDPHRVESSAIWPDICLANKRHRQRARPVPDELTRVGIVADGERAGLLELSSRALGPPQSPDRHRRRRPPVELRVPSPTAGVIAEVTTLAALRREHRRPRIASLEGAAVCSCWSSPSGARRVRARWSSTAITSPGPHLMRPRS